MGAPLEELATCDSEIKLAEGVTATVVGVDGITVVASDCCDSGVELNRGGENAAEVLGKVLPSVAEELSVDTTGGGVEGTRMEDLSADEVALLFSLEDGGQAEEEREDRADSEELGKAVPKLC